MPPIPVSLTGIHSVRPAAEVLRPRADGKFFFVGTEKLYLRGVSYGAFEPTPNGEEYTDTARIEQDFALMAAHGFNLVRVPHTTPPRSLLDAAERHGLYVMVGLSAEQHVGYLIDRKGAPDTLALVREKVRRCAGHPALLAYALGNEIPAPVARWLGRRRVERYLRRIHDVVRREDPGGLVTYVNYPTTEYLDLPFLDFLSFNVYLESRPQFVAYLKRLQNLAGDRPLLMSEIGLDALRNGLERQASVLDWQLRASFAAGCAGAVVFSFTDEWFRAGAQVEDWAFGLTDRERRPKPALWTVERALAETPFPPELPRPSISVVVCTYNGARTVAQCLDHLCDLKYPRKEILVVDDGSTDATAEIVAGYDVKLIRTENQGLSAARNVGLHAASGDIVAYIDDDAYPDAHWLDYLAASFAEGDHVGVGGPNIPPAGDGSIADCVANAPGGPVHVLLDDERAEHLPGCNMAFRRSALLEVGGFDPRFRAAGDDVDICWRLQERGGSLAFSPAAVVWHHRRNSVAAYWKQQVGYGRAEALLEAKWPAKYNSAGHHTFQGRIYGRGRVTGLLQPSRIYHGAWGMAPFQSLYPQPEGLLRSLPIMPEWFLGIAGLAAFSLLGLLWRPLFLALPALIVTLALSLALALRGAANASFPAPAAPRAELRRRLLTACLYLIQPLARLSGRLQEGLTLWRRRSPPGFAWPRARQWAKWSENWVEPGERCAALLRALRKDRNLVVCGNAFDAFDIEVRGGLLGAARVLLAVEDHGAGTQYVRARSWPRLRIAGRFALFLLLPLAVAAASAAAWAAASALVGLAVVVLLRALQQDGGATAAVLRALPAAGGAE